MIIAILSAIMAAFVGIAVLMVNPQRLANQAYALTAVLAALWLCLVVAGMVANDPLLWMRANAILSTLAPFTLQMIISSVAFPDTPRPRLLRRALPWLIIPFISTGLSLFPSFAQAPVSVNIPYRGWSYYTHAAILGASFAVLAGLAWREMRRQQGVRRLEIQLLALYFLSSASICLILLIIGNILHSFYFKSFSLPILGAGFILTALAIAHYQIFNLRQTITIIGHRLFIAAMLAGGIGIWAAGARFIPPPYDVVATCVGWGFVCIWAYRASIRWFGIDGGRELVVARTRALAAGKTAGQMSDIISQFQDILRDICGTPSVAFLLEPFSAFGPRAPFFQREDPSYRALVATGWATPERLQRTRADPERIALRKFLAVNKLGLALAVPGGSESPSLILLFETKTSSSPFTYPEILRLQYLAELMDNILAHSRLATQAAFKAKTEHLAMMSRGLAHDLKNLLTPVSSFLVHTAGRFPPGSDEAEVHEAARRSIRIMGEYVREARFFAEQLTPQFEEVFVPQLFETLRELTKARGEARGVQVETTLTTDTSSTTIIVDRVLLQRLLGNLVANAIDAYAAGGTVTLTANVKLEDAVFTVTDQGCGIAPEHLGRIFEPYFTTKEFGEEVRGFGLGLTICQKIAALHGGDITVDSDLGRGSTFTVRLPGSARSRVAALATRSLVNTW